MVNALNKQKIVKVMITKVSVPNVQIISPLKKIIELYVLTKLISKIIIQKIMV